MGTDHDCCEKKAHAFEAIEVELERMRSVAELHADRLCARTVCILGPFETPKENHPQVAATELSGVDYHDTIYGAMLGNLQRLEEALGRIDEAARALGAY